LQNKFNVHLTGKRKLKDADLMNPIPNLCEAQ